MPKPDRKVAREKWKYEGPARLAARKKRDLFHVLPKDEEAYRARIKQAEREHGIKPAPAMVCYVQEAIAMVVKKSTLPDTGLPVPVYALAKFRKESDGPLPNPKMNGKYDGDFSKKEKEQLMNPKSRPPPDREHQPRIGTKFVDEDFWAMIHKPIPYVRH